MRYMALVSELFAVDCVTASCSYIDAHSSKAKLLDVDVDTLYDAFTALFLIRYKDIII
jgi:hypothetical protein